MKAKTRERIEKAVIAILKSSNMDDTSVCKVPNLTADRLGIDLSLPGRQSFVREIKIFPLSDASSVSVVAPMEMSDPSEKHVFEPEGREKSKCVRRAPMELYDNGKLLLCNACTKDIVASKP